MKNILQIKKSMHITNKHSSMRYYYIFYLIQYEYLDAPMYDTVLLQIQKRFV